MALGLYEALFAALGSLYGERAGSAITGITLVSGFATTLSWPAVALVIEHVGWRTTCVAYGVLLVIVVAPLYLWVLARGTGPLIKSQAVGGESFSIDRRIYLLLTLIFALGAVIMTAMSVQLISLLQGQGYSLAAAIGLSALLGPSHAPHQQNIMGGRHEGQWQQSSNDRPQTITRAIDHQPQGSHCRCDGHKQQTNCHEYHGDQRRPDWVSLTRKHL